MTPSVEQTAADTIKALSMDAVQAANSGHPGMPMGMADLAVVLWGQFIRLDPGQPAWPDRDRFVLSNGHGSMLLYSLLHLMGYPLSLEEIANFRQWGFPTAGHPERELPLGIETTTGPLGQGFGNGVGMAMAEAHLRAVFGPELVDHYTYGFVSDGDLMEGVASEAASLAGHLGLGKLIYIYDDNEISIEGSTGLAFSEDVPARFDAYGWHTVSIDGHDRQAIAEAIREAQSVTDRPTLIAARTHIGHGAPTVQDTADAHGKPLGDEELARTKELMGWELPPFTVPDAAYQFFAQARERGAAAHREWDVRRRQVFDDDPARAELWKAYWNPVAVKVDPLGFEVGASVATRKASGAVINQVAVSMPSLIGGSADLAPSTNTIIDGAGDFAADRPGGRNLRFGVREHAMGAVVNGMVLHGGLRAYGATFLTFSDYMRPSVRLAALMEIPSIWVWTHDSVFLGEDGPTHQPVEHLASLRAMPNMWVLRPGDATETAEAWELVLNRRQGPSAIILTRQGVPVLDRSGAEGLVARGGYVLRPGDDVVLIATGSELHVALGAAELLAPLSVRVVSMPCVEAFLAQDESYRSEVLGVGLPRASIEAAATFGWDRIVGDGGLTIGIDHFGASAPATVLAEQYGFTPEAVASAVSGWLEPSN